MGWRLPLRYRPKVVQALRMTVSSLGAFALAQALALPQGFWAVITALIVTQANVGGSLKAALDRFIGSVFGAVYGSVVAFAIPHEHGLSRAAALVVAVAPLSFIGRLSGRADHGHHPVVEHQRIDLGPVRFRGGPRPRSRARLCSRARCLRPDRPGPRLPPRA